MNSNEIDELRLIVAQLVASETLAKYAIGLSVIESAKGDPEEFRRQMSAHSEKILESVENSTVFELFEEEQSLILKTRAIDHLLHSIASISPSKS